MNQKQLDIIRQPRLKIIETLEQYTLAQLNTIPSGFNNNIMWNLGHMVAVQQGICYKRAGVPAIVADDFYNLYKPDSKPTNFIGKDELDEIRTLLTTTLHQFEKDYNANLFSNYPAWTTRYGVEIANIDDALAFLPFHEGLHIGYIMSMRKLV